MRAEYENIRMDTEKSNVASNIKIIVGRVQIVSVAVAVLIAKYVNKIPMAK